MNMHYSRIYISFLAAAALALSCALLAPPANAQQSANSDEDTQDAESEALTLDDLLLLVEQGRLAEDQENRRREARFRSSRNRQAQLLDEAQQERDREEARSKRLEGIFEQNQEVIVIKREKLLEALGSLTELFGHMTGAAGDLRNNVEASVVSIQYPNRTDFLDELIDKISASDKLPNVREIERLWFELQREMTEAGKVVSFEAEVIEPNGERKIHRVVRIGSFNAVDDSGRYLAYNGRKGNLAALVRQPSGPFNGWAEDLASAADNELHSVGIDPTGPTGGSFLASLIDAPTIGERWRQGGIIGYLISIVGLFALWLACMRLYTLSRVGQRVDQQLSSSATSDDNPLGRVLGVYEANRGMDVESLELKLSEAILHERPALEHGQNLLKIIAAIAPLMGLLGTVTGMILTFQGIVIFGAGDPKAMAGGISQALVTTVLGLTVAIPTVLFHTLVSGRSARILRILEERATGLIAERAEAAAH